MKILNYFDNREDCKEFLEQFNFKYFIPYLDDLVYRHKYHVQLSEDFKKVVYCCLERIGDNITYKSIPFYDIDRMTYKDGNNGYKARFQLAEQGEADRNYIKKLEVGIG